MRVHATQPDPYALIDALRSAQRSAAKREAAIVRKELLESGSELLADSDFSDLSATAERRKQSGQRKKQNPQDQQKRPSPDPTDSEDTFDHISDWA